jgi:hypothetical protein
MCPVSVMAGWLALKSDRLCWPWCVARFLPPAYRLEWRPCSEHLPSPDEQRLLSQPAEIMTVEGVVDGDDGVQIPGAVPLAASVTGPATGVDSWQRPASGEIQQGRPPGGSGQPEQPAQLGAASDSERLLQGAGLDRPAPASAAGAAGRPGRRGIGRRHRGRRPAGLWGGQGAVAGGSWASTSVPIPCGDLGQWPTTSR